MVELKVKQLAKSKGIKTAYQLQVAADLYPSHAAQLWSGTTSKISLEVIDRLCAALDCEPGELFKRTKG